MEYSIVPVKWAQHKKFIVLVIEAKNIGIESINFDLNTQGQFKFWGTDRVNGKKYCLFIDLYEDVVVEESKWKATDYCIEISISKRNKDTKFWPRLTKLNKKFSFISVDWARWTDEDEACNLKNKNLDPEMFDDFSYDKFEEGQGKIRELEKKHNACIYKDIDKGDIDY